MPKVKIYQYKKCSTCIKALKFLTKKGVSVESIDITEKPPAKKELETMLKNYDGEIKKLFNTSGSLKSSEERDTFILANSPFLSP